MKVFLDDAVQRDFKGLEHDLFTQTEKGHGRIEMRRTWVTDQIDWLKNRHDWAGLQSVAVMDANERSASNPARNAAENLSRVHRIALTLLRQDTSDTASLRRKRLRASTRPVRANFQLWGSKDGERWRDLANIKN